MFCFQGDHRKKKKLPSSRGLSLPTLARRRKQKQPQRCPRGSAMGSARSAGSAGPAEPALEHYVSQNLLLPRLASVTSVPVVCLLWLVFLLPSLLGVDLLLGATALSKEHNPAAYCPASVCAHRCVSARPLFVCISFAPSELETRFGQDYPTYACISCMWPGFPARNFIS